MLRGLLASLILHAGVGYVLVYGVPAIPLSLPDPDVFDVSLDVVDVADDAPILALALEDTPATPSPIDDAILADITPTPPEEETAVEEAPDAVDDIPLEVPSLADGGDEQLLLENDRLEVAQTGGVETQVETTIFDATQDAALGRGADTKPETAEEDNELPEAQAESATKPEAEQPEQNNVNRDMVDEMTVSGGDADALADALETLTETVIEDSAPAPKSNLAAKVQEQFGDGGESEAPDVAEDRTADSPDATEDVVDLTPEIGTEGPTDQEAENAFATMPVPKMRPTRRPAYIDTEAPEDQDRLVSTARLVPDDPVEDLIAAAMEQAAVEDARLAAEAAEAAEIARVAAARQAEADARQSARDAANASASRQINAGIADNMDWPIFIRAQDQWKFGATVTLKDLSGGIASVQVRILNAPASADPLQMRSVRDALERSIWASGPWPIPTEYYEDWLDIPEFVLCPPVNALTVSLAC